MRRYCQRHWGRYKDSVKKNKQMGKKNLHIKTLRQSLAYSTQNSSLIENGINYEILRKNKWQSKWVDLKLRTTNSGSSDRESPNFFIPCGPYVLMLFTKLYAPCTLLVLCLCFSFHTLFTFLLYVQVFLYLRPTLQAHY